MKLSSGPERGKGYGRKAIGLVLRNLAARKIYGLYTSCGEGKASPPELYQRLGFAATGVYYDDEAEMKLIFTDATVEQLLS
ncbi:hypothetical protein SAMN04488128_106457 [Chitinophaga eiseniae]|uniref:Acetyltransferase (GNAT) family protein n=1 Tax=Chitinophaga eiseniae TaxID=634771 RepID=A0A1T4TW27_9BACT|nr:hypothetical protein [Chitinophaga eiseniae]SKA44655.1 hypothetical protein SAMN04488128_106457 [Chitinophaga eiseniae]